MRLSFQACARSSSRARAGGPGSSPRREPLEGGRWRLEEVAGLNVGGSKYTVDFFRGVPSEVPPEKVVLERSTFIVFDSVNSECFSVDA